MQTKSKLNWKHMVGWHNAALTFAQFVIVPYSFYLLFTHDHNIAGVATSVLITYLFCSVGFTIGNHRYFAHRAFKTTRTNEKILSILAILGTWISPLRWAASHYHHHKHSDTEYDIHSPSYLGWKSMFFLFHNYTAKPALSLPAGRLAKDSWHTAIHKYIYFIILFYALSCYMLFGFNGLVYGWLFPTSYTILGQMSLINAHDNGKPIDSTFVNIMTMGDGNHAKHHDDPKDYEKDIFIRPVINFIKT